MLCPLRTSKLNSLAERLYFEGCSKSLSEVAAHLDRRHFDPKARVSGPLWCCPVTCSPQESQPGFCWFADLSLGFLVEMGSSRTSSHPEHQAALHRGDPKLATASAELSVRIPREFMLKWVLFLVLDAQSLREDLGSLPPMIPGDLLK